MNLIIKLIQECKIRLKNLSNDQTLEDRHGKIKYKQIYDEYFNNIETNSNDYIIKSNDYKIPEYTNSSHIIIKKSDLNSELNKIICDLKFFDPGNNYKESMKKNFYESEYKEIIEYMTERKELLNKMNNDVKMDLLGVNNLQELDKYHELIKPYPKEYNDKLKFQTYKFYLEEEKAATPDEKIFYITKNDHICQEIIKKEKCEEKNKELSHKINCDKLIEVCNEQNIKYMPEMKKFGHNNLYRLAIIGANTEVNNYYYCTKYYIIRDFFTYINPVTWKFESYKSLDDKLKYKWLLNKIFVQSVSARKLIFPIMFIANECKKYTIYEFDINDIKGLIMYKIKAGLLIYFIILDKTDCKYKVISLWRTDSILKDFLGERKRICFIELNIAFYTISKLYGKCFIFKIKDTDNYLLSRYPLFRIKNIYKKNNLDTTEIENLEDIKDLDCIKDTLNYKIKYLKYKIKYLNYKNFILNNII